MDSSDYRKLSENVCGKTVFGFLLVVVHTVFCMFEEFSEKCHNGLDIAYYARRKIPQQTIDQVKAYEKISGISLFKGQKFRDFDKHPRIAKTVVLPKKDFFNWFIIEQTSFGDREQV